MLGHGPVAVQEHRLLAAGRMSLYGRNVTGPFLRWSSVEMSLPMLVVFSSRLTRSSVAVAPYPALSSTSSLCLLAGGGSTTTFILTWLTAMTALTVAPHR